MQTPSRAGRMSPGCGSSGRAARRQGVMHPTTPGTRDIGADAISVSNHGGKHSTRTGVDPALPPRRRRRRRIEVLLDGGIRRGSDVVSTRPRAGRSSRTACLWGWPPTARRRPQRAGDPAQRDRRGRSSASTGIDPRSHPQDLIVLRTFSTDFSAHRGSKGDNAMLANGRVLRDRAARVRAAATRSGCRRGRRRHRRRLRRRSTRPLPPATPDDLAQTVKEVEALGRRIVASQADVRDYEAVEGGARRRGGPTRRLDIVVATPASSASARPRN